MIAHLPDAEVSDVDPIQTYLRGLEHAAALAQDHYRTSGTLEDAKAALGSFRALEAAKLETQGVTCPECGGAGEVESGWLEPTPSSPGEMETMRCPTCKGKRVVLPDNVRI